MDTGYILGDESKKLTSVKTMPNFNQIPRNDSHESPNSLGANLKRDQSSGADLPITASSVRV